MTARNLRLDKDATGGAPAGFVGMFNASSCPAGWITANGSNSTADARGRALRGLDLSAGRDPTGSTLAQGETNAVGPLTLSSSMANGNGFGVQAGSSVYAYFSTGTALAFPSITTTCSNCTTETRMDSVVLLACQKL